ncbi:AMP-dependent synthetase [Steroidobacter agaridevorans]|uniref:AMP-dependent synthetase n=1 Tax=Steroidobacter agaridevorans TaxID=2695856 RepID=A0A829YGN2_9GAMM|nr:AMP-dependent synthetase [Steroidobacter agaridevorans]
MSERVSEWLALYGSPTASAAWLLCDGHDPAKVAYRIVAEDLSSHDLTYRALREDSERVAAALASLGVRPGDRVATLMGKSREYLVTLMGIWRLGAVHVPLFTAFASPAIQFRLQASGTRIIVVDPTQLPKLTELDGSPVRIITTGPATGDALNFHQLLGSFEPGFPAAVLGGDAPFIQIYTSGTTGKPKGVVVPIRALASFRAYVEFGLDLRSDDIYWCAADPGWAYGLYFGVLASFSTGTMGVLVQGGFSPAVTLAVLERYGVTNFAAAPTVYRALRASNLVRTPGMRLRCASSAGEPLTPDVNAWATSSLGIAVHDHYGQTETGMLVNNHHHQALRCPLKAGSMGSVMPGWKAAILHQDRDEPTPHGTVGRLAFELGQSPLAWFTGYRNDPEKSAEKFTRDGCWYLTGDVAQMDDEGYLYFSSRDDDVIIMAGYRIGPFEVESVLATHSAVVESAVIAAPDAVRGEVLEAFVVLRPGVSGTNELAQELQRWVKTHFAAHAYPRTVHFADSLPKTPSGKVQRFVLRERRRAELAETTPDSR